jgi:hypothetical protein
MTESRIERLAEAVLATHGLSGLPVDPLALARLERILLAPGDYDGCFDARIQYRRTRRGGGFFLFYAEAQLPRRPASRVRYTVAHELGHYFLPGHRDYLLSGRWLGARTDHVASRRLEREANWFAAALLMPRRPFIEHLQRRVGGSRCRLDDLAVLAGRVFQTSLTSTAVRYAQLNFAPCCVVLSEGTQMRFSVHSEEMRLRGLGWVEHIPEGSITGQLLAARAAGKRARISGQVSAAIWFGEVSSQPVWEEVKVLGGTGRALTLLQLGQAEDSTEPSATA